MRDQLRAALTAYTPGAVELPEGFWPAAVLFLIYEHDGEPHVVFQKRTSRVEAHKGEVSLPGGAVDTGDADLAFTALRETHEEIGVQPDHVELLGQLDQLKTISNFVITPYAGWLSHYPYAWNLAEAEVAYLLEVPIAHLADPATFVPDVRTIGGREIVLPSYRVGDDLIWGATGRMVSNFLDLWAIAHS